MLPRPRRRRRLRLTRKVREVALITVASAKGSPGVTTTALLLGGLWPRPVVVAECDPSGSDIALRLPSADKGVLDGDRGLLSLAAAGRKSLHPDLVPAHTQRVVGGLDVLLGLRVSEQAAALGYLWPALGPILAELPGYDVIADCGRLGATTPQNAVLSAASDAVFVVTTAPSSVVHLRERLTALQPVLRPDVPSGTRISVVVIADPKRTRAVKEVQEVLERASLSIQVVHHLAHDPRGAGFFAGQIDGSPRRTALVRSAAPVVRALAASAAGFWVPADEASPDDAPAVVAEPGPEAARGPDAGAAAAVTVPTGDPAAAEVSR